MIAKARWQQLITLDGKQRRHERHYRYTGTGNAWPNDKPTNVPPTGTSLISMVLCLMTGATDPIGSINVEMEFVGFFKNFCEDWELWDTCECAIQISSSW